MGHADSHIDWNDLRFALAADATKSLSRAARALGVHQTTVGRRIEALEDALGTPLFLRTTAGLRPTPEGERLLVMLRNVASALEHVEKRVARPTLPVRVAVTENGARLLVRRAIKKLRDIRVELVVSNTQVNLARGDADLAVRVVRPEDPELVASRIDTVRYALYASREYLDRHGTPGASFEGHAFVVPSGELAQGPEARFIAAQEGERAFFANSLMALALAAEEGIGLAVLPTNLGALQNLVRVRTLDIEGRAVWLVLHRDARRDPRIRAVAKAVEHALQHVTRAFA